MPSSERSSAARTGLRAAALAGAALAVLTVVPAQARDASVCAQDAAPVNVTMEVERGRVVGDLSLDKAQLTARFASRHAKGTGARMTTGKWDTVGLTESSLEIVTSTSTLVRSARGGGYCADLRSVRLKVGYPELRVYIPREYPTGSCAYDVVREHELEHVAITRAVLDDHAPRLRTVVAEAVQTINPLWAPTREAAKGAAAKLLHRALEPAVVALKADHRRRNKAIDGHDNYVRLQRRCDNW
ncbi:hypothetical protein C882_3875 [Caenispirillum salinarum AK4]|uniref:DUF922 domain-containing protein n=1 Tax=Caenispirillum salinarum AK4 TaxID=1238182 RepID=K9H1Q6_9PROT|nr:hypothetical protein [Caenispirillum salinarum]EKV31502.1 hypothetical protein C882_3875 [Caenispirillum salinarum AK4]